MKKLLLFVGLVTQLIFCSAWAQTTPNYSDLWWNQNESGWGMMLNHQGDIIFAPWFTYGADGKARWYIIQVTRQPDGSYSGPVAQTTGTAFNLINGSPSSKSTASVGSATFRFASDGAGTVAYTIGTVSQSKAITRQQYAATPTTCIAQPAATSRSTSQNYQDLWWVPAESGWGVNLAHQGDILFVAWFTYGADGSAQWLFGSNVPRQADGSYAGPLYRATGTPFSQINGLQSLTNATAVGNVSFRFADGERGVMTYTADGEQGTKNIVRQVFGSTVSVCTNIVGAMGPIYKALSPAGSSSGFIAQANTEGSSGYRYRGDYFFSDGQGTIYVKDNSQSSNFSYRILTPAGSSSGFVAQANSQGASGYKYQGDYFFSDGAFSIYIKDNSQSATFSYRSMTPATSSSGFVAQANSQGASGYKSRFDYFFSDGIFAIYVKDNSQSATFSYKALAPAGSSSGFVGQANSEGAGGYRFQSGYNFSDGIFSIYLKDNSQSSTFGYKTITPAGSSSGFISQANSEGAGGYAFQGGYSFSDGIFSIYVKGPVFCSGFFLFGCE